MDIHKNARLSLRGREEMVRLVVEGLRRWANGWRDTRALGAAGLLDRSSRPHRSPRRLASSTAERVVELRRGHMPGYAIARHTGASPPSGSHILRRARLSRWRDLNPPPPVVRYRCCPIKGLNHNRLPQGGGRLLRHPRHRYPRPAHRHGSSYRSHQFKQACQQMQLKHGRTRPYTPRTNGKAERFIQTALRE